MRTPPHLAISGLATPSATCRFSHRLAAPALPYPSKSDRVLTFQGRPFHACIAMLYHSFTRRADPQLSEPCPIAPYLACITDPYRSISNRI